MFFFKNGFIFELQNNTHFKNLLCPFIILSEVFAGFLVEDDVYFLSFLIAISLSGPVSELLLQFPFS